ncbi:hypothetical protein D3C71_835270 [compost metagenome]
MLKVPVIVAPDVIVTACVAEQPSELVYVIVLVPGFTPVTSPVFETVATAVFEDVHGLDAAAVPLPVNCVVDPAHTVNTPPIVGVGFTIIVALPV